MESGDVLEGANVACDEVAVAAKGGRVGGGGRGEQVGYESLLVVEFAERTRDDWSLKRLLFSSKRAG